MLKDKVVIITGAGSGVGRAASEIFARAGAGLVCADIRLDWLEKTVATVRAGGGDAAAIRCDVSQKAAVEAMVDAAVRIYGRLDVIYNNAGIASPVNTPGRSTQLVDTSDDQIDRLIAINMRGVIHGCQAAVAQFRRQGGGGAIVNTASVAGLMGWGGVIYGATKGAIVNLTRALAIEVAPEGIRVNSVCPGGMATNFMSGILGGEGPVPDAVVDKLARGVPMKRLVSPADCAYAAMFLASDYAPTITGVNLPVDSGMSAGR